MGSDGAARAVGVTRDPSLAIPPRSDVEQGARDGYQPTDVTDVVGLRLVAVDQSRPRLGLSGLFALPERVASRTSIRKAARGFHECQGRALTVTFSSSRIRGVSSSSVQRPEKRGIWASARLLLRSTRALLPRIPFGRMALSSSSLAPRFVCASSPERRLIRLWQSFLDPPVASH